MRANCFGRNHNVFSWKAIIPDGIPCDIDTPVNDVIYCAIKITNNLFLPQQFIWFPCFATRGGIE